LLRLIDRYNYHRAQDFARQSNEYLNYLYIRQGLSLAGASLPSRLNVPAPALRSAINLAHMPCALHQSVNRSGVDLQSHCLVAKVLVDGKRSADSAGHMADSMGGGCRQKHSAQKHSARRELGMARPGRHRYGLVFTDHRFSFLGQSGPHQNFCPFGPDRRRPLNVRAAQAPARACPTRFCVTKRTNGGALRMFDPQNRRTGIRYQGRNGDVRSV
jgi:hypothetical protein